MTVEQRGLANLRARQQAEPQGVDQLAEEERNPVIDLRLTGRWNRPCGHLHPAAADDLLAVRSYEFMQHGESPTRTSFRRSCLQMSGCSRAPIIRSGAERSCTV